ncbi:MAG TPA: hypothetical protein VNH18_19895 [Bryobacteraceae bacterium]|nr:hypothetical protein [Bryobacteraceae bacterium]
MTVADALELIRRVGVVDGANGVLRLRFPEKQRTALQPAIDTLRQGKAEALMLLGDVTIQAVVPPLEHWPESLRDLAEERTAASGNPDAARRELWLSWADWKAGVLNRLLQQEGITQQRGRITAATVLHGEPTSRPERNTK